MKRKDYIQKLFEFVESRRDTPYKFPEGDCCNFVADAIVAMTDSDPAANLRGSYHTPAEAKAIIDSHGGLKELISSFLGEPLGPLCARRGDVVFWNGPNGECVGVCVGNDFVTPGDDGLVVRPMTMALKSWKVD